jgi:membrane-anchored protein YejM (alkaline phosphatase superfamily)
MNSSEESNAAAATTGGEPIPAAGGGSSRRLLLRWAGWFSCFNLPVLLVIAARYASISGCQASWSTIVFLTLTSIQHFLMVAWIPLPFIALAVLFLPWPKFISGLAVLLGVLLVALLAVDTVVLSLFRFHLNGMVWSLLVNGGVEDIITLSRDTYFVAGAGAVVISLAQVAAACAAWRWVRSPRRLGKFVVAGFLLLALLSNGWFAGAHALGYTPILRLERALPLYTPLTAKRTLQKMGFKVRDALPDERVRLAGTGLRYPLEPLKCSPASAPLNIVAIAIDGWRFDMLSEKSTPNIEAFARKNIRFADHSAAARCTRFGIFGLFYGIYGTYWDAMLVEQRGPVLIDELDKLQYQFGLFGSASLSNPEFDLTVFSHVRRLIPPYVKGIPVNKRDVAITDNLLGFIDSRDAARPFLGFVFYDSSHGYAYPQEAPAPFQPACAEVNHLRLNSQTDPVPLRNRYLNAVHYVDSLVGRLLTGLEARGLLDSTIVIITGDHGEEFNETGRNYWGHGSNFSPYETQVPFVMHWPGRAPEVIAHKTSHLDFVPTLMHDMLGCQAPTETYSNGRNLFDSTPRLPLVVSSWKCLAMYSPGRIDVLYESGYTDHFDDQYRDLKTPVPPELLRTTLEGLTRFSVQPANRKQAARSQDK